MRTRVQSKFLQGGCGSFHTVKGEGDGLVIGGDVMWMSVQ